jgi:alanine dehydrogenase
MRTLFLTRSDIESVLTMKDSIQAVENAFKEKAEGTVEMPVRTWLYFKEYGGDLSLLSAYLRKMGAAGMKVDGYNLNNPKQGLPTITAVVILNDPKTSFPISIMNGTLITGMRTGAVGSVAAKYLSRKDSKVVCIIGAGVQGRFQLMGLNEVFSIEKVKVYDMYIDASKKYAVEMGKKLNIPIEPCYDARKAVEGSDIIVTVTPSRKPIVMEEWVKPGAHINAIGADEPGKEELDPNILKKAKIVVDDYEEAIRRGEVNVPLSKGIMNKEDIYAELAEVVAGKKKGRESGDEITVFDATGLAIEDVAVGWEAYKKAKERNLGKEINLVL